ncbi:MAG: ABC transporter substrate-binding protein [Myxococcales bacterium]|nr:ABC transporter substrate-binding protein [Myxococcales bacterium]
MARVLIALAVGTAAGCSFVTARGFEECAKDSECAGGAVCLQRYCIRQPEGCNQSLGATDNPRRIALAAALPISLGGDLSSGQKDESEKQGLNAMALALEEVNQRDGVAGRPFALYVCDTAGDKDRIKQQATWLAEELLAPAVITSGSSQTIAAQQETVPRGTLIMTATATSPEITFLPDKGSGSTGLVWRTAPSDAIQGRVIADLLIAGCPSPECNPPITPVTKVGVVYLDDPYGQGLKEVLAERFNQPPREIRSFQYSRNGEVNAAVNGLSSFGPQATVLIAFPDDAVRVTTAAAQKANLTKASGHRWLFTDSAKDPTLVSGSPAGELDAAYGTAPAQGAGAAFQSFSERFLAKYQVKAEDYSFTAHSYDAMYVLALGAAYAVGADGSQPVTGERIAEGLTKLSLGPVFKLTPGEFTPAKAALQSGNSIDIEGASGKLNFDPATGEAASPIELWQVSTATGGSFATVKTIAAPEK